MKDSYFSSRKGNVKTMIGNSNNSSSHGERAKAARFYFATIKNNNFIKSCRRVILMARTWIKRQLSTQKKIQFMDVWRIWFQKKLSSQPYMVDIFIISLNISTKPTSILRKSKGNSYSQTCMIFHSG